MEQVKEKVDNNVLSVEELVKRLPESALKKPKEISLRRFKGMANFKVDALAYQRKLRNEWK